MSFATHYNKFTSLFSTDTYVTIKLQTRVRKISNVHQVIKGAKLSCITWYLLRIISKYGKVYEYLT